MQTFKGKTIAAATATAAKELNISREMMKITVTQQPRKGFLGIGRREAVIQVEAKQPAVKQRKTARVPYHETPAKKNATWPTKHNRHGQSVPNGQKEERLDPAAEARRQAALNHQKNIDRMKHEATAACSYLVDSLKQLGITATAKPTTIKAHPFSIELSSK